MARLSLAQPVSPQCPGASSHSRGSSLGFPCTAACSLTDICTLSVNSWVGTSPPPGNWSIGFILPIGLPLRIINQSHPNIKVGTRSHLLHCHIGSLSHITLLLESYKHVIWWVPISLQEISQHFGSSLTVHCLLAPIPPFPALTIIARCCKCALTSTSCHYLYSSLGS